jgi:hypothetical protein
VQVDDGQPAHPQTHRPLKVEPIIVRPAMANGLAHLPHQLLVHVIAIVSNYACDSTHVRFTR